MCFCVALRLWKTEPRKASPTGNDTNGNRLPSIFSGLPTSAAARREGLLLPEAEEEQEHDHDATDDEVVRDPRVLVLDASCAHDGGIPGFMHSRSVLWKKEQKQRQQQRGNSHQRLLAAIGAHESGAAGAAKGGRRLLRAESGLRLGETHLASERVLSETRAACRRQGEW